MQHGVVLGFFGVASLVVFRWSFSLPFCSTLFGMMLLATPVLATVLTFRYRRATTLPGESFGFAQGFLHALFTGFYASVWIALAVFVYLRYFDHGAIFVAYANSLDTPEMKLYMQQSGLEAEFAKMTGGEGVKAIADAMQNMGAATYAAMSLYCAMLFGPVISLVIGLLARRG